MQTNQKSYLYFVRIPLITLILLLSIMGIFSRRGWLDWQRMAVQNIRMHQQIDAAAVQRQALERQLEAFRADSHEQERVIRQSLGYVHKSEIVIQFD